MVMIIIKTLNLKVLSVKLCVCSSGGISDEQQPGSSAGGARCAASLGPRERRRAVLAETAGTAAAGLPGPGERPAEPRAGGSESPAAATGTD